jgi:hypothetical protein
MQHSFFRPKKGTWVSLQTPHFVSGYIISNNGIIEVQYSLDKRVCASTGAEVGALPISKKKTSLDKLAHCVWPE